MNAVPDTNETSKQKIDSQSVGRVPTLVRQAIQEYWELVHTIFDKHALSLTLFGMVAESELIVEFNASRAHVQNTIVVDSVDLSALRILSEQGMKLSRQRIASPIMMTPSYIKDSCDTFALEMIDITQNRIVLFGEDYFTDLEFHAEHVRLQIERELKVILTGMRQSLLGSLNEDELFATITEDAARALVRVLRGFLWINGERERQSLSVQIAHVEEKTGRKLPGLRHALDPQQPHGWNTFQELYDDVQSLGELADAS
jgi:hypothetical protein